MRVTTEKSDEEQHGFVVTFDDITELVSAQRNSAWADIARRIAHEIKNPLTPIQLSAERLQAANTPRRSVTDPQVFEQCTSTIIRQVGDIGRMVDEFSSFARMPSAVLESQDLTPGHQGGDDPAAGERQRASRSTFGCPIIRSRCRSTAAWCRRQ